MPNESSILLNNILEEVIAGLAVTILLGVLVFWRKKIANFFQRRRIFFAGPRLASSGISNIVTSRAEYNSSRTESSLEEFVATATTSFEYFGVAFTSATGPTRLDDTFREMLRRGVKITIYMVDPAASWTVLDALASLYGYERQHLKTMCSQAVTHFKTFRDGLSQEERQKFFIYSHSVPLDYSAFIFDEGIKGQKLLIDCKIFGIGKDHSYGIQFDGIQKQNTLYSKVLQSLSLVRNNSTLVPVTA